jgi:hypothetical protein
MPHDTLIGSARARLQPTPGPRAVAQARAVRRRSRPAEPPRSGNSGTSAPGARYVRLPYGRTMAPAKTLLLPDRAPPRPARENRSQRCGMALTSSSGKSQAKTHNTMPALQGGEA